MKLVKEKVFPTIMYALSEDVGSGDITSALVFEKDENVMADIHANGECVLAGIDVMKWIFNALDERIVFRPLCKDGDRVKKGKKIISLRGSVKNILAGERTALNFLGRLSGVATLTSRFVEKAKGTKARIFDTRKTMPGMRVLEKYAVRVGGGCNHRMGLWDGVLIKDNHVNGSRLPSTPLGTGKAQGSRVEAIKDIISKAKSKGYKNIEIEVSSLKEFKVALGAGVDIIMLDNMVIKDIKKAVNWRTLHPSALSLQPILEVSGGVTLENVSKIAKTGVDRISIGFLTHSAPSIDFSLEICQ